MINFYACTHPCNHHSNQDMEYSSTQKTSSGPLRVRNYSQWMTNGWPMNDDLYHLCLLVLSVFELRISGIIWYVFFCVWQFSHNIMSVRIIHVVECISSSFFLNIVCYFTAWTYHNLFSHFIIGRQWVVSGFRLLQYAMSIWKHISLARINHNFWWKSRIIAS